MQKTALCYRVWGCEGGKVRISIPQGVLVGFETGDKKLSAIPLNSCMPVRILPYIHIMSTQKQTKINLVLQSMVPGVVLTSNWLAVHGVSNNLARRYVASGWLERIGQGAYIRCSDNVDWQGGLYALQSQLGLKIHVGGLSALRLKGMGHFLSLDADQVIQLFSETAKPLPAWFREADWGVQIKHRSTSLLGNTAQFPMSSMPHKSFDIEISPPEQAAFEMLYCLKNNSDFDHARTVFEGLGTLRPKESQELLQDCRSVRVKRLFLWMAKNCGHPWIKYVDIDKVDLGSGKRVIYEGGELDRELLITVPRREGIADV